MDRPSATAPVFKDRKTGLMVFGILQIILGAFCALMVPFMLLGMIVQAHTRTDDAQPMRAGQMIPSLAIYTLLAAWFIVMGIGSIRTRRWARALVLVSSWLWLICGLLGVAFMLYLMPAMYEQMVASGKMPQAIATVVKFVMIGFMVVFYVIIPTVLILFYGSMHVKATCEGHDPQVCWTDLCPLPVLAMSLLSCTWAAGILFLGCYGWAIPFFGTILNGTTGAMVILAGAILLSYLAWGLYRLRIAAWWCAVGLFTVWGFSTCITFSRVSLMDLYVKMSVPAQQLETMKPFLSPQFSTVISLSWTLWIVIALAYLLYMRKYFTPKSQL